MDLHSILYTVDLLFEFSSCFCWNMGFIALPTDEQEISLMHQHTLGSVIWPQTTVTSEIIFSLSQTSEATLTTLKPSFNLICIKVKFERLDRGQHQLQYKRRKLVRKYKTRRFARLKKKRLHGGGRNQLNFVQLDMWDTFVYSYTVCATFLLLDSRNLRTLPNCSK